MEFPFDVNHVLPFEITILDGDYRVLNPGQLARILAPEKLTRIIDAIGEASYKAQGLHGAVTTARKFRISDHRLYIIKKADDNNNFGSVIGLLKVGPKHLYIYDSNEQVYERTPLCVLDFYVHESRQRLGYGRKLFDTMLGFEKCAPYELAIDRPSSKCLAFLHKHYNLSSPIHQVNNFVVYHAFFNQSSDQQSSALKQHQEYTPWLLPTQKQQHKPFSEQIDVQRNQRMKAFTDENYLFGNHRQNTTTGTSSVRNDRQPASYYTTSYGRHYNPNTFSQGSTNKTQSAHYTPRIYSEVFKQSHSHPHPSRNDPTQQRSSQSKQLSSMNNDHRTIQLASHISKSEPSSIKSTNNRHQQQSTIESSSSAWRIFGIPQLFK